MLSGADMCRAQTGDVGCFTATQFTAVRDFLSKEIPRHLNLGKEGLETFLSKIEEGLREVAVLARPGFDASVGAPFIAAQIYQNTGQFEEDDATAFLTACFVPKERSVEKGDVSLNFTKASLTIEMIGTENRVVVNPDGAEGYDLEL